MKGIYSALLVPFDKDGKIMEDGLRQVIRHNIEKMKIDGLYVGGSTGENFLISTEEKKLIFKITAEEALDKIHLIAQVGSLNLQESVELGKYATGLGYKCLSAVTPFYYKFSFEDIKNYYQKIITETGNNMLVYSIPMLSGVTMNETQIGELLSIKKVIGIKFTSNDFFLLERVRKAFPDKIIFNGFDELLIFGSALGVDGAIGSTYNVTGPRARAIYENTLAGNMGEARKLQHIQNDVIAGLLDIGLFQGLKELLKLEGIDAGYCREPMPKYNDNQLKRIKELHKKYFCN